MSKIAIKHTAEGEPVHSFKSLLADLATNRVRPNDIDLPAFSVIMTPIQRRAFGLFGVSRRLGYA